MWRFVLLGFVLVLGACSDPKGTILPTQIDKMETIKPAMEKLSGDERQLLAAYVTRHTLGTAMGGLFGIRADPIPEGMTIGKAIDEQREFIAKANADEAQQTALKEKMNAERERAMDAMRKVVTVTLLSKKIEVERGYSGIVMDEKLVVSFGYKNNSDKDIAGVKGTVDVRDLFGDELAGFNISNDSTIKAGATSTWTGSRSVQFGMNATNDRKFAALGDDKFQVVWSPKIVVFTDGSRLTSPE